MLWAHYDRDRKTGQSLEEHLLQVRQEMERGLETVSFSDSLLPGNMFGESGAFHDLGKITTWFQIYLTEKKASSEKTHALISAALYAAYCEREKRDFPFLPVIAITCHHGGMNADLPTGDAFDYLEKQYENCIVQGKNTVFEPYISVEPFSENKFKSYWRRKVNRIRLKEQNPEYFFGLQFLFSKLIAADKLDSAGLLDMEKQGFAGDVDGYILKKTDGKRVKVTGDREQIREAVLKRVEGLTEQQIEEQRIFTLTAPTGTGKTLTSVSAALLLADRLEQHYGVRPHLITAVPFLNILEQTIADYKGIFDDVLVHSSAATETSHNSALTLQEEMLVTTAWSGEVVLTTFVQLFESILNRENRRLLKVNRLANAIVILDEIQSLKAEWYPLFAVILDMAAKHYGTRFILMTATQPKLFACAAVYDYVPCQTMELLPEYKQYFQRLERTKLVSIMNQVKDFDGLYEFLKAPEFAGKNILIVVNKIADSIQIYNALKDRKWNVLYLSTNITGKDRKRIIAQTREYLENGTEPVVLVSTQTIEAGVDLDFDVAFRDLAPLESIIQVAGRVNRSGKKEENHCPVYIFHTGSAAQIYSCIAVQKTASLLEQGVIPEAEYQTLIEQYYDAILNEEGVSFERELYYDGILKLDYERISKFQMIDGGERYSVIIVQDETAENLLRQLCEWITKEERSYEQKIQIQKILCQLGQYTVDIFAAKLKKNLPIRFADYSQVLCGKKIELQYFVVPRDDVSRYYNETGFIAEDPGIFLY